MVATINRAPYTKLSLDFSSDYPCISINHRARNMAHISELSSHRWSSAGARRTKGVTAVLWGILVSVGFWRSEWHQPRWSFVINPPLSNTMVSTKYGYISMTIRSASSCCRIDFPLDLSSVFNVDFQCRPSFIWLHLVSELVEHIKLNHKLIQRLKVFQLELFFLNAKYV